MHATGAVALICLLLGGPDSLTSPADTLGLRVSGRVAVELASMPGSLRPGGFVTVQVEVRPQRGIHVYAPGNRDYLAPLLSLDWPAHVKVEAPRYPPGEPYVFGDLKELVQVYNGPFRITQKVTLPGDSAAPRRTLEITGTLRYQSCDDRVCFPVESIPLRVEIPIGPARRAGSASR
jgi:hypothetical protein